MKYLILLFSSLLILNSYGQGNQDFKKVLLGVNFSPDYCYRALRNTTGSADVDFIIREWNNIEIPKPGFTAGCDVGINFSRRVGMGVGVQYASKGYQTKFLPLIFGQPTPDDPQQARMIYRYNYIEVPVKVNYKYGENNYRLIAGAGLIAGVLSSTNNSTKLKFSDGRTDRKNYPGRQSFDKVNLSLLVSLGLEVNLSKRLNLRIEPTFRHEVLESNRSPIATNFWSAGLNMGVYFGL